jgi:hypothetical protein
MDGDESERRREWMSAFEHFTSMPAMGSRRKPWSARGDERARALLTQFLLSVVALLAKVQTRFSTQLCECLNSLKAKLACKGISWKRTWEARVCVAILNFNLGHSWKMQLYDRLVAEEGWPNLPERCRARLMADFAAAARSAEASRDPERSLAAARLRIARRRRAFERLNQARARGALVYGEDPKVAVVDDEEEDGEGSDTEPETEDTPLAVRLGVGDLGSHFANVFGYGNPRGVLCHLNAPLCALLSISHLVHLLASLAEPGPVGQALIETLLAGIASHSPVMCPGVRSAIEKRFGIKGWFSGRQDAADTFSYLITALISENALFEEMFAIAVDGSVIVREGSRICVRGLADTISGWGSDLDALLRRNVTSWPLILTIVCEPIHDSVPAETFALPEIFVRRH